MGKKETINFYANRAADYNCYAFALNARNEGGVFGHPGSTSGNPLKTLNPNDIDSALRGDGLEPAKHEYGQIPQSREGYYLVAAVAAGPGTSGLRDYHFYRQMDDGSWWHDPGKLPPTNLDTEGAEISNPEFASRDYTKGNPSTNPSRKSGYDNYQRNYDTFVGYYYVPNTGLPLVDSGGFSEDVVESPAMRADRMRSEKMGVNPIGGRLLPSIIETPPSLKPF